MTYVVNTKAFLSAAQTVSYVQAHGGKLRALLETSCQQTIFCTSALALYPLSTLPFFDQNYLCLAAQSCSSHDSGAFTGHIPALFLRQLGVTHCIVGHKEQRLWDGETDQGAIKKIEKLIAVSIIPIVCIAGQSGKNYLRLVEQQLIFFINFLKEISYEGTIFFAHEPDAAVDGTEAFSLQLIQEAVGLMHALVQKEYAMTQKPPTILLLYGGSVNETNSQKLKCIAHLDGFLIGRAFLDFQTLEKIIK